MRRAQAGVTVTGVMDDGQVKTSQATEYDPFMQAGLDVRLDGNVLGLMHHKVIIIDQQDRDHRLLQLYRQRRNDQR